MRGFPKDKKASAVSGSAERPSARAQVEGSPNAVSRTVKLFGVTVSPNRTAGYPQAGRATNDLSQASTDAVQQVCGLRWKIEEFHRELKQLTQIKHGMFSDYLIEQLKNPSVKMALP